MNWFIKFKEFLEELAWTKLPDNTAIKFDSRECYQYREGDKVLLFGFEPRENGVWAIVFKEHVRWLPPYEMEAISSEKKTEIGAKLLKYFERRGGAYVVEF